MPKAINGDVQINYEIVGDGLPLVLMHGFSGNLTSFYGYGYVDALRSDYQLIMLDARGHGESSKPHHPEAYAEPYMLADEYEARLRAADIEAGVAHLRWSYAHLPYYGDVLNRVTMPCLIFAGEQDEPAYSESQECVKQLPNATFYGLPDLNHVQVSGASALLVPRIKQFLAANS